MILRKNLEAEQLRICCQFAEGRTGKIRINLYSNNFWLIQPDFLKRIGILAICLIFRFYYNIILIK